MQLVTDYFDVIARGISLCPNDTRFIQSIFNPPINGNPKVFRRRHLCISNAKFDVPRASSLR